MIGTTSSPSTASDATTARYGGRLAAMGRLCAASGVLGLVLGAVTLGYPAAVPENRWSYPFGFTAGLLVGVGLAVTHLLSMLGVRGLQLTRPRPARVTERVGLAVVVAGFVLLAGCELVGGLIGRSATDDASAVAVGTAFGVASLLTAGGSIGAGVAMRRDRRSDATRWLLASAVVMIALVTPANISGNEPARMVALMLWSLCFIPLGSAVRRLATRDLLVASEA